MIPISNMARYVIAFLQNREEHTVSSKRRTHLLHGMLRCVCQESSALTKLRATVLSKSVF